MIIYIKETIDKIQDDNSDQDFFSGIKICKKKELVLRELRIIEHYFIKKIFRYLQEMVLILKPQKE